MEEVGEKLNELKVFDVAFPAYYCVLFGKWRGRAMENRAKYRLVEMPGGGGGGGVGEILRNSEH